MLMKNKKADLAATLLVLMAIVVAGAASIIFIISSGKIKANLVDSRFIDGVYLTKGKLDFYINEIMNKAVVKTRNSQDFKQDFIANFSEGLIEYKINNKFVTSELSQIEQQIDEEHIEYDTENNIVTAEFKITLNTRTDTFNAVYTYNEQFEKQI